ncbi:MAG: hypothetical protein V3V50_02390 [Gammaproteobacteria bacterium]
MISVQPRIRLNRSFDERNHGYLGYSLRIEGAISGNPQTFWVGIGKAAQDKCKFQYGVTANGKAHSVQDSRIESVEYYKVSGLSVSRLSEEAQIGEPPWHGIPPGLDIYRSRGHRRLSPKTYESRCSSCIWGCRMPVIITVDHWNPEQRQFRFETFCYGPKSCRFYKPGSTRKVPGRKGMSWEEEDWVDEEATAHRELDE